MEIGNSSQTPSTLKEKISKYIAIPALIGTLVGFAGGYAYYYFIGCASGSCPITSNPYISIAWGGLMGYLLGDMFVKGKKSNASNQGSE
jgi:presenilin-like A22 family membrane protease